MKNAKNLLKALEKVEDNGKLVEFVNTEVKDQYISNFINSGMYGYGNKVYMDLEGNLSITFPMRNNAITREDYEGVQIGILTIPCFIENDFEITESELMDLNQYQTADLYTVLMDEVNEEYKKEYSDIYSFLTPYSYPTLEEKFKQLFPDRYDFLLNEHAENRFGLAVEDGLADQIQYIKTMLRSSLECNYDMEDVL